MKSLSFKLLVLLTITGLFSGCSLLNQPVSSSSKSSNSSNAGKPAETPTLTQSNSNSQDSNIEYLAEQEGQFDDYLNDIPKRNLDDQINQSNYDKIKDGMNLDQVSKIFDDQGMLIADMTVNGRHSLMYLWSTGNMKKKIKVTFEKDKVVKKEKAGF